MTQVDALFRLQELDLGLLKRASALAAMPQQARLKTIDLAAKKVASELKGIVGQRKDAETEVSDAEAALSHYHEKTAEVRSAAEGGEHTHREVRSLEQQLTSLAKHIEKAEYSLVPLREKLEKLQLAERNARLMLERLEGERAATDASLKEESASLRAEIVELSREREQVANRLGADLLERYEVARKRFKGLAVERLHGNVPSICRVKLQPSLFHDLSQGYEITECPYCHRILVTSEKGQE